MRLRPLRRRRSRATTELREAIEGGVDYEKVPLETKSDVTGTRGGYRALIQVTEVAHQRYIDKGWRLK